MSIHGRSIVEGKPASGGSERFQALNPATSEPLEPVFFAATASDVDQALSLAENAFDVFRQQAADTTASFLENIAAQILTVGDQLIARASAETGLPVPRLIGERTRTLDQLRMFAGMVREGSWVEAIIDLPQPERKPLPKPDLRRMLIGIGPVVVFGASNFPLAFSVAGGDTASAFAAGNPVIVKAHPAHPGTSELVAEAIVRAVDETGLPAGIFSLLQGNSPELSLSLARHPATAAIGFTGSLRAGRAIYDAATRRPCPIPVYAEMGSVNPVFVLPGALTERADALASGLLQSVTLGVGQFCTCPGLVVGQQDGPMVSFLQQLEELIDTASPATMLHSGILHSYEEGLHRLAKIEGVRLRLSGAPAQKNKTEAQAAVLATDSNTFLKHGELGEEVFGPATVIVTCSSRKDMMDVASTLGGHLTATVHGTADDLREFKDLIVLLEKKVGRLIYNGFPTGVEVCAAMQHGGPYPATTDPRTTSVGGAAIKRFARPVCFQNFPQESLPIELQNNNQRRIWRTVDGELTKEDLHS